MEKRSEGRADATRADEPPRPRQHLRLYLFGTSILQYCSHNKSSRNDVGSKQAERAAVHTPRISPIPPISVPHVDQSGIQDIIA
jgi:hypothetical protein